MRDGGVYLMSTILLPWVAWNSERSTPPFLLRLVAPLPEPPALFPTVILALGVLLLLGARAVLGDGSVNEADADKGDYHAHAGPEPFSPSLGPAGVPVAWPRLVDVVVGPGHVGQRTTYHNPN